MDDNAKSGSEDQKSSEPVRDSRFDKWLGAFPAFKNLEEINAWIREMRDDEESEETETAQGNPSS